MAISLKLDEEGGVDPDELLGGIVLEGENGSRIEESTTFLDTFLLALAQGLVAVAGGARESVDIFDEPNPLLFDRVSDKVTIEYKGVSVLFDYDEIAHDLIDSYQCLTEYIGLSGNVPTYVDLNETVAFLSKRL
jgi:hypothetical protein